MDAIRHRRLEELLLAELSSLILSGEIKDPRVGPFVSLTRIEAASDLSAAKVFVSAFGADLGGEGGDGKDKESRRVVEAVAGLQSAAGFIQARVGKRIKLRLTPKLTFIPDHGIKEGFELNERIKGLLQ